VPGDLSLGARAFEKALQCDAASLLIDLEIIAHRLLVKRKRHAKRLAVIS
jgi:hypothetical protein